MARAKIRNIAIRGDRLLDALWAPSVWTCKSCLLPSGTPRGSATTVWWPPEAGIGRADAAVACEAPERRQVSAVGAASSVWACLLRFGGRCDCDTDGGSRPA